MSILLFWPTEIQKNPPFLTSFRSTQVLDIVGSNGWLPDDKREDTLKWFEEKLDEKFKDLKSGLERRETVLYPPGKCIHFFRDGVGISAVSTCIFIKEDFCLLIIYLICCFTAFRSKPHARCLMDLM